MIASYLNNGSLSLEIVLHILSYGDLLSVINFRLTSKSSYADSNDSSIWKRLLHYHIPNCRAINRVSKENALITLKKWIVNDFKLSTYSNISCGIKSRYLHRAVTLSDGRVFIFSGAKCRNDMHLENYNDMWELCLETNAIVRRDVNGLMPHGRCASAMACIGDKIFIFGGLSSNGFSNDFWCFNTSTNRWIALPSKDGLNPPPRWGHTLVAYGNTLVVYAGSNMEAVLDDIWVVDVSSLPNIEWKQLSFASSLQPMGRSGHSATIHNNMMYIYGGNTHGSTLSDFWRINLDDLSTGYLRCYEIIQNNTPRGRIGAAMFTIGNKIFMFGGRDKMISEFLCGFFVFDTTHESWKCLHLDDSLIQPRTGHCAFATPTGICFFGGYLGGFSGQGSVVTNQFVFLDVFERGYYKPIAKSSTVSVS